jgi:hypothetical protein
LPARSAKRVIRCDGLFAFHDEKTKLALTSKQRTLYLSLVRVRGRRQSRCIARSRSEMTALREYSGYEPLSLGSPSR